MDDIGLEATDPMGEPAQATGPGEPVGTVAVEEPASLDEPRHAGRRNPWNVVLAGLIVLMLVGAGVLFYRARSDQQDASDLRAAADDLDRQKDELAQQAAQVDQTRHEVMAAAAAVHAALRTLDQGFGDVVTAHNNLIEISNRAVDLSDNGNEPAARALAQGDGAAALAELQRKVAALDQDLVDVKDKASQLQEANHV